VLQIMLKKADFHVDHVLQTMLKKAEASLACLPVQHRELSSDQLHHLIQLTGALCSHRRKCTFTA
jgi:hypothetical protein